MTIRDTVIGIERNAIQRSISNITYYPVKSDQFEVVIQIGRQEQRIALCNHEGHAQDIVKALKLAHEQGVV